jgi:hypothetical protein
VVEGRTLDYTRRYWGHDFALTPSKEGKILEGHVWSDVGIRQGDYVILPNGDRTTRYQVETARWCGDPDDMWRVKLKFAPRKETTHA